MNIRLLIAALFCASVCSSTQALVIVTHGFNASHAGWYQPGGDFYEELKTTAAKQGHDIQHFTWNQRYRLGATDREHAVAGTRLALEIAQFCDTYSHNPEFPNNHEIIVVAHSYGGLVSYHASRSLENLSLQIEALQSARYSGFTGVFKKAWDTLATNWQADKPQPVISKLFTLGTPHQDTDVIPSKKGVTKIYNIYSTADRVASDLVAGGPLLPMKLLRSHRNGCNVLLLGQTKEDIFGFGHSQIHHPLIAASLFDLTEYVDTTHPRDDKHSRKARHVVYTVEMPEDAFVQEDDSTTTYENCIAIAEKLGAAIDWKNMPSFDWQSRAPQPKVLTMVRG